jgi:hypothetical protein
MTLISHKNFSICGTIQRTFKISNSETLLKLYKIIAVPTLLYWCKNWVLLKQHERRNETAEMKFLRSVVGYTMCDYKTNEEIRKEIYTTTYMKQL